MLDYGDSRKGYFLSIVHIALRISEMAARKANSFYM